MPIIRHLPTSLRIWIDAAGLVVCIAWFGAFLYIMSTL